jgi:excisionase family DNA binding protein
MDYLMDKEKFCKERPRQAWRAPTRCSTSWRGQHNQPLTGPAISIYSIMNNDQQSAIAELSLSEAAQLLGIDRRTVKSFIEAGLLRVRFAGRPGSAKPRYRIPLDDVLSVRNSHRYMGRTWRTMQSQKVTKKVVVDELEHISLEQ